MRTAPEEISTLTELLHIHLKYMSFDENSISQLECIIVFLLCIQCASKTMSFDLPSYADRSIYLRKRYLVYAQTYPLPNVFWRILLKFTFCVSRKIFLSPWLVTRMKNFCDSPRILTTTVYSATLTGWFLLCQSGSYLLCLRLRMEAHHSAHQAHRKVISDYTCQKLLAVPFYSHLPPPVACCPLCYPHRPIPRWVPLYACTLFFESDFHLFCPQISRSDTKW